MKTARLLLPVAVLGPLLLAVPVQAQPEDDQFAAGLVAEYAEGDGHSFSRIEQAVMHDWTRTVPHQAAAGPMLRARWHGYLMSQTTGHYQLHAYVAGRLQVRLRGEVVLEADHASPAWSSSRPIDLQFDFHRLEVTYQQISPTGTLKLFWSGPQFPLEPLGQRYLFHDASQAVDARFERGGLLVAALRCGACHEIPGESVPARAPALEGLSGNLHHDWVVRRLTQQAEPESDGLRRMPHFALDGAEAEAIAAYVFSQPRIELPKTQPPKKIDRAAGEELLLTLGCLACHRVGALGHSGPFSGGDLTAIAAKRPAAFFEPWLAAPEKLNRDHRMPVFDLSTEQRRNLAEHLATLGKPPPRELAPASSVQRIQQGQELFARHRCAACHRLGPDAKSAARLPLRQSAGGASCLQQPRAAKAQPGYQLAQADREAVQHYLEVVGTTGRLRQEQLGQQRLLAEHHCLACHQRDESQGLAERLPAVAAAHPNLAPSLPAMTPPPLISVGDKLYDEAIRDALLRKSVRRDYLLVQMPQFRLDDVELQALIDYFVVADRVPPRPDHDQAATTDPLLLHAVGSRLVTAGGFGCTSCHQVGQAQPSKAPINARGPTLTMLGQRVRREWFDRFIRNPLRVVPRMEMPSIQVAVGGVLGDDLPTQLNAVWDVLNTPGFEPPLPDPVRIVRRAGIAEWNERAVALTDVLRVGKETHVKPLLIGLPNRHGILFDLEHAALTRWSLGDVANQRTEGKTWFWEAVGNGLIDTGLSTPELALAIEAKELRPRVVGQFVTEFDELFHVTGGLGFRHRLHFEGQQPLHLTQQFVALWPESDSAINGVERTVGIAGVPRGASVRFRLAASGLESARLGDDSRSLLTRFGTIQLVEPSDAKLADDFSMRLQPENSGTLRIVLRYVTDLPIDQFPTVAPTPPPPEKTTLQVVPGFETVRLPLSDEFMPAALAWRPNGDLAVASLKGRVWLARDSDGDHLPDVSQPISDELAAPYGLVAADDHIDVLTKYGLLRLLDQDADGQFSRAQTIASGWGHTADYHDWAVGLPRDPEGNYYIALPCQQDERSEAAAHLRGTCVKLVPRAPTAADPRLFSLQPLTAGHRFPMGIARNRGGELFVTDNQGHYNPFNELNHVIPGRRYGFINRLERRPEFQPKLTPPAIDIPHPWTRSVNGICFLDTPTGWRERGEMFGPFEGHLLGCEYDTRRLIRMSLQRVGETYQGAAYPFSYDAPTEGPALLGPLVCAVSPQGEIYVGGIRDSGWGGANNVGEIVRLRRLEGQLPVGIAEVRALSDGFVIDFTAAVDPVQAADSANYSLASYTRVSTPAYGGPDEDRRQERIVAVSVADDARQVRLQLPELRAGYVYEFHLKDLAPSHREFFPAEAHYTLRVVPGGR